MVSNPRIYGSNFLRNLKYHYRESCEWMVSNPRIYGSNFLRNLKYHYRESCKKIDGELLVLRLVIFLTSTFSLLIHGY